MRCHFMDSVSVHLVLLAFCIWTTLAQAIPIDNGVVATSVQCTAEAIAVNFTTRNPFNGRIFVQGMSDRAECVRNYADGGPAAPAPIITFTFGECNMQRTRTLSPQPGMLQSIVVVISFHRIFITKVDRAYKIQCFYMETEKTVTSQLDVSMLTTENLRQTFAMPTCSYVVKRGSRSGEVVRYAKIGEPVFHEWECESDQVKILIKSCYADDGQGNRQQILDEKGCAIDPVILSDLAYDATGNARASVESHVFKYADKPSVFFQCSIQICAKGEAQCESTSPPKCIYHTGQESGPRRPATSLPSPLPYTREGRIKRGLATATTIPPPIFHENKFNEMDLITDPIAVLDLEDSSTASRLQSNDIIRLDATKSRRPADEPDIFSTSHGAICMSTTGFAFLVGTVLMLFLGTSISALFICIGKTLCSRRTRKN